jgi:hypothetical protein
MKKIGCLKLQWQNQKLDTTWIIMPLNPLQMTALFITRSVINSPCVNHFASTVAILLLISESESM